MFLTILLHFLAPFTSFSISQITCGFAGCYGECIEPLSHQIFLTFDSSYFIFKLAHPQIFKLALYCSIYILHSTLFLLFYAHYLLRF